VANALLRRFGPQDDAIAGDLLEGFQRRSGSKIWYWWQVGSAIRVAAIRELRLHPLAVAGALATGWVISWLAWDYVTFPMLDTVARLYGKWRFGYAIAYFGPLAPVILGLIPNCAAALGAVVAVRVYNGHRPILALIYAVGVVIRGLAYLTINSIVYDPTSRVLHYTIDLPNFPPLGLFAIVYLISVPVSALIGGLWSASRQPRARSSTEEPPSILSAITNTTDMFHSGVPFMGESVKCAVCGKPIEPNESRLVDVAKGTKVHVHMKCKGKR
jgi:hypothetical protein